MERLIWVYITTVFIFCVVLLAFSIRSEYVDSKQDTHLEEDTNIEKEVEKDLQSAIIDTVNTNADEEVEEEQEVEQDIARELRDGEYYGESVYVHFNSHKDNIINGRVTFNIVVNGNIKSYTSYDTLLNDVKPKDIFTKQFELYDNQTLKSYTFTKIE